MSVFLNVRNEKEGERRGYPYKSQLCGVNWRTGAKEVAHHPLSRALPSGEATSNPARRWEQLNDVLKGKKKKKTLWKLRTRKALSQIWMQDRRFHKTSYKQITSQVEWDVYIPEKSRSVNLKLQILSAQKSKLLDGFKGCYAPCMSGQCKVWGRRGGASFESSRRLNCV